MDKLNVEEEGDDGGFMLSEYTAAQNLILNCGHGKEGKIATSMHGRFGR